MRSVSSVKGSNFPYCLGLNAGSPGIAMYPCPVSVSSATWQRYTLPLQKPLTTGATANGRHGLMLRLVLKQGNHCFYGVGEVAPLPGKHLPLLPGHSSLLAVLIFSASVCQAWPAFANLHCWAVLVVERLWCILCTERYCGVNFQ